MNDEPLWKSLRRTRKERRGRDPRRAAPGAEDRRARLVVLVLSALVTFGAIVVGSLLGNVHPPAHPKPGSENRFEDVSFAWASAVVLAIAGTIATRRAASLLGHLVAAKTIRAAGVVVRIVTTILGYLAVLFAALGLLDVSLEHILTDATFAGVVLGIAAQQSLGNLFAGMVLLVARPFTIGDHIRIRSGALGGIFDGVVLSQTLTYVTLSTDDGLLKIPNSGLLAAAVGPFRAPPAPTAGPNPTTGQVPVTGITAVIPAPGTDTRPPALANGRDEAEVGRPAGSSGTPGARRPSPWRELAARESRPDGPGARAGEASSPEPVAPPGAGSQMGPALPGEDA